MVLLTPSTSDNAMTAPFRLGRSLHARWTTTGPGKRLSINCLQFIKPIISRPASSCFSISNKTYALTNAIAGRTGTVTAANEQTKNKKPVSIWRIAFLQKPEISFLRGGPKQSPRSQPLNDSKMVLRWFMHNRKVVIPAIGFSGWLKSLVKRAYLSASLWRSESTQLAVACNSRGRTKRTPFWAES